MIKCLGCFYCVSGRRFGSRLELLYAAGGWVDDGVDVVGDLHCVEQERTGFTTRCARCG